MHKLGEADLNELQNFYFTLEANGMLRSDIILHYVQQEVPSALTLSELSQGSLAFCITAALLILKAWKLLD